MMNMIKDILKKYKELVLYVIFGALTTLINFSLFFLLNLLFGEELYLVNNIIAAITAVTFSFIANKLWVFESKSFAAKTVFKEMAEFYSARLLSLVVDEGGMWLLVEVLNFDRFSFTVLGFEVTGKLIAKLTVTVIVVILNYVFSKFVIFRKNKKN